MADYGWVHLDWREGVLTKAVIHAGENSPRECVVRYCDKTLTLKLKPGAKKILTPESF